MVPFYNALGGLMWVTESRVEEYKALGYREYVETSLVSTEEPRPETEEKKAKPKTRTSTSKKK